MSESQPYQVLLIEDSPGDSDLACERLADVPDYIFEVTRVATLKQATDVLDADRFDAVILDLSLPDSDGLDTVGWAARLTDSIPIVVLSGNVSEELRRNAYRAGVQDFIGKDEPPSQLLARSTFYAIERHRANAVQRQMHRLVEANPDAVLVVNTDGRVLFVNRAALRLFGRSWEDFVGEPLGFSIQEGEQTVLDISRTDGDKRAAEIQVAPIDWEGSSALLASIRDVTEQQKLREQLVHAQKMEAIGTLAGGMAHEINNILAVISGNATLARAQCDPSVQSSLVEIEKAVDRGADFVRQILAFSRHEETVEREVVAVQSVIEDAARFLRAALPASVEVVASADEELPPIRANATQLHVILMNLGNNAAHAMEAGGGTFEIQAQEVTLDSTAPMLSAELQAGRHVRIVARDTGKGMDGETLERIFEPFFSTKGVRRGTGLGLSVVQGIVKSHRGAITVYSEPGKGTVFHLYFPVIAASAAEPEPPAVSEEPAGTGRVLFVDDEEALVRLYSEILARLGYEAVGFHRPAEAIAAFRDDPDGFDLVLTDMSMPEIDGPKLVQEILAIRPATRIVMATGYVGDDDLERVRRIGVRELIHKPYSMEALDLVLRRVLAADSEA